MLCVHVITGLNQGGAEATLRKLVAGDNSGTSHVVVSLMDDGELGSLIRAAGIEVLCLGMKRGRFSLIALAKLVKIIKSMILMWFKHGCIMLMFSVEWRRGSLVLKGILGCSAHRTVNEK